MRADDFRQRLRAPGGAFVGREFVDDCLGPIEHRRVTVVEMRREALVMREPPLTRGGNQKKSRAQAKNNGLRRIAPIRRKQDLQQ